MNTGKVSTSRFDSVLRGFAWQHPVKPAVQDPSVVNTCAESQFVSPSDELQQFEALTRTPPSVSDAGQAIAHVHGGSKDISSTSDRFNALLEHDMRMKFEKDFASARLDIAQHINKVDGMDRIHEILTADSGVLALVSLAFDTDSIARKAQGIFAEFCREYPDEGIISILRIHSSIVINDDPLVDVEDVNEIEYDLEHISVVMQSDTISTTCGWILLHYYNQRYTDAVKTFLGKDYQWFRSITDFLGVDARNDCQPVLPSALQSE